jgi:hypothetical protein
LAREYGAALGSDQYFAGHWRIDLVPSLAWYAKGKGLFGGNPERSPVGEVTAPSWSWANAPLRSAVQNDWATKECQPKADVKGISVELMDPSNPFGGITSARLTISGPVYRFSQVYHPSWRSSSNGLSAFECHLSSVIELDYPEAASQYSQTDSYAALMLLREFPSSDHRMDALILKASPSHKGDKGITFERLGILKLSFFSGVEVASPEICDIVKRMNQKDGSLEDLLDSDPSPRKSKRIYCKKLCQEYNRSPWTEETVTII